MVLSGFIAEVLSTCTPFWWSPYSEHFSIWIFQLSRFLFSILKLSDLLIKPQSHPSLDLYSLLSLPCSIHHLKLFFVCSYLGQMAKLAASGSFFLSCISHAFWLGWSEQPMSPQCINLTLQRSWERLKQELLKTVELLWGHLFEGRVFTNVFEGSRKEFSPLEIHTLL